MSGTLPQFIRDVIERWGGWIPLLITVVRQLGVSNTDHGHRGPRPEAAQPGWPAAHLTAVDLHCGQDHLSLAQAEVRWLRLSLTQWPAVRQRIMSALNTPAKSPLLGHPPQSLTRC